jgi:hypothetical protein
MASGRARSRTVGSPLPAELETTGVSTRSVRASRSGLTADIVAIDDVPFDLLDIIDYKPSLGEQTARLLFTPHGTEVLATLGQRDGHAVQRARRVERWRQRMVQVFVKVTGGAYIDRQEAAAGAQRAGYIAQDRAWPRLIVDRVENGDEIERIGCVQFSDILFDELRIGQSERRGLRATGRDTLWREIVTTEATRGERLGHEVNRVSGATGNVGHIDAFRDTR